MIDDKELASDEANLKSLAGKYPDDSGWLMKQAKIIRNARRYLALRGEGVSIESVVFDYSGEIISGDDLDAAADRLLEGE